MNQGATPSGAPPAPRRRRWPRWAAGVAALLLMPKCLVCIAGYLALAAGFSVAGAEICGAGGTDWLAAWSARLGWTPRQGALVVLMATIVAAAGFTLLLWRSRRQREPVLSARSRFDR